MMILLSIVGVVFLLGLCMMITSFFTAPEGFEDETGFHAIARKQRAQTSGSSHGHSLGLKGHASAA